MLSIAVLWLTLPACSSAQRMTETNRSQVTTNTLRDSIYLHDSVHVEYKRGSPHSYDSRDSYRKDHPSDPFNPYRTDTLYIERWHTRWRDRETVRTDTIQVDTSRTETVRVRHVPAFYKYCAAFAILVVLYLLVRLALYLFKRFYF